MTTIWQRIAARYGFTRPYDFTRALPAMVSASLVALTLALRIGLSWLGVLPLDTPKQWFLEYLLILALLALVISVRPVVAGGLLLLFLAEAGLASASWALTRLGVPVSYLVPDSNPLEKRFRYHPLLQVVPTPLFSAGKRFIHVTHNSRGFRGPERDPGELEKKRVIAAFGGSTTYDLTVPDGKTWTEQLERELGADFAVLNFGVPGYTTVEHIIQTTFYSDSYGVPPVCALYYIGWNDIRNAYPTSIPGTRTST